MRKNCFCLSRKVLKISACLTLISSVAFAQNPAVITTVIATEHDDLDVQFSKLQNARSENIAADLALAVRSVNGEPLPPVTVSIPPKATPSRFAVSRAMESELSRWTHLSATAPKEISQIAFEGLHLNEQPRPDVRLFIENVLIPNEAKYYEPGLGMDERTGFPYDHIRYRPHSKIVTEVGNYTAASKLSLSIPFLLNVVQGKPGFRSLEGWSPSMAKQKLVSVLNTLQQFNRDFPAYHGFLPWVDIRPNGTIAPANTKIPSLDNGQLTWALVAVAAVFQKPESRQDKEIRDMSEQLLRFQNYEHFYDSKTGMLHGTVQISNASGEWVGDQSYYLNDMFEGTMAVLWAVLKGQVPETAWKNLKIPTVDYQTLQGDTVTTLQGYRSSFHEWWALAYLPFMQSPLAPLFRNYFFVQADHATRNHLPGFTSTGFDAQGVYRQMGVPAIAGQKVDRDDVSVVFGTAISMLISPYAGGRWLKNLYAQDGLLTPYGAVESMGPDGFADIFTADAKGMTLLAASGGMNHEIESYLKTHRYLNTDMTLYEKLMKLFEFKYQQMLEERDHRPVLMSNQSLPLPSQNTKAPQYEKPVTPGAEFDIAAHLQAGHLHGKNVTSAGEPTLEDDIRAGNPIRFDYDIPPEFIYFDQWAFRGTYLDQAVRIADMNYLSVKIPAAADPAAYEIELKSDDITLATAIVKSKEDGQISEDGKYKTLVYQIHPINEADYKALNYVSISLHDPRYSIEKNKQAKRYGRIEIDSILLTRKHPFHPEVLPVEAPVSNVLEIPILKFWRLSHGDMPYRQTPWNGHLVFDGGAGWRGGYVPYTDIRQYHYLYLKIRNQSGSCNCLSLEMKHELSQLLGHKVSLVLDPSGGWQYFEIKIPKNAKRAFNYLALSDAIGKFEIGSVFVSQTPISSFGAEKVDLNDPTPQTRCQMRCQVS